MTRLAAVALIASGLVSAPADAQDFGGVWDVGAVSQATAVSDSLRIDAEKRKRVSSTLRSQITNPVRSAPSVSSLPYRSSPAVRAKVVDIFLAAGPKNPAYVAEIRKFVGSGAVFREYDRYAPQLGLRLNDAVDAYTLYLLAQWVVANDYRPEPTRAQVAGVRAQAARALASVAPALREPAARQEFAETLLAQGVIMASSHGYAQQRGDERTMRALAAQARRGGVVVFNMDPTKIALTDSGFRLRGRADAGGSVGGGVGEELVEVAGTGGGLETLSDTDTDVSAHAADAEAGGATGSGAWLPLLIGAAAAAAGLWALRAKRRRSA